MWLALKLLASGAFDAAMKGLSVAAKWLLEDWRHPVIVALAVFGAFHHFVLNPRMEALIEQSAELLAAEQAAHLGTVNAFLAASKQAQKDAEVNAQRVAREQETITDAITSDYRSDLAALRARFDRLRAGAAPTDPGRADAAGLPRLPDPADRADAPAGEDRLPAARGLSLDDALIASEQALQLQALIDWVNAQAAVRFTPNESPQ